ncbi:RHS repeat-associated core domain [Pseudomonas asplenii]|uniref:RHS repeat-associated core domain n=1 Tax=Pseudomonas asplenii TaxID=53407 RepID=A0A0N0E403_9PSED|nr:RHS repeat-associated core domain-containing protein [Pseudomonas fuscovaginae]KPA90690.1 RHS repeat-associated core domain [Pseudomonas fuscovaginae]
MAILRTLLSQYRYDPLDRLVACSPVNLDPQQRFYCKSRLATEIQGAITHSFFQSDDWRMAQQRRQGADREATLLATDQQGSVLQAVDGVQRQAMAYSPYGHRTPGSGLLSLLGFSGEQPDPVTGHYLLGNGYRAFNPVLMRFNSPDSLSPFGKGGINAYRYCEGDPVNQMDPTGHAPGLWNFLKEMKDYVLNRRRGVAVTGAYIIVHGVRINPPAEPGHFFNMVNKPTESFSLSDFVGRLDLQSASPGSEYLRRRGHGLVRYSGFIIKKERELVKAYKKHPEVSYAKLNNYAYQLEHERDDYRRSRDLFKIELREFLDPPPYESPPKYSDIADSSHIPIGSVAVEATDIRES